MTEVIEDAVIVEPGTDLVPTAGRLPISFVEDPEGFLEDATRQAKVLKSFLEKTNSVVKIGPSEHVKVGGWQFLAQQAGLSVGTTAEPITLEDGDTGFKGHAIVYRDGLVMGEGHALCLRSERNWKTSDTYAICSMAQTRAISKAIKGVLGFVVVMAGYSDTPAEEMMGVDKPKRSAGPKKDKAQQMRSRILELAGQADEKRGDALTLDEIEHAFSKEWQTSLADAEASQLEVVGKELKLWIDSGCQTAFELVPF